MIQTNNKGLSFNGRTSVSKTDDECSTRSKPALTDAQMEKQKGRIAKLGDKWLGLLGLRHWRIYFLFERKKEKADTKYRPGELKMVDDIWDIVMTTQVDPYYLEAKITIYLPTIKELNDEELEESFLHECCHIMVSPISKPSKSKEEELVATSLARAIQNTFNSLKNNGSRSINPRRGRRKRKTTDLIPIK